MLAGDTGDTALNASEVAIGDYDMVATFEMTLGAVDEENVVVVDARQTDEVIHLLIGDDERWVLAVGIGAEVVVVVAEVGIGRGGEGKVHFFLRGLDEEQIGNERLFDAPLLTVFSFLCILFSLSRLRSSFVPPFFREKPKNVLDKLENALYNKFKI